MSKDKTNVPYDAPWASNLKHRPDPNRVSSLQTPMPGKQEVERREPFIPAGPATSHIGRSQPPGVAHKYDPQAPVTAEPSYYDVPMLKPPVWEWMIAVYFYLGGVSAGSYLIARMAERFGGRSCQDITRAGSVSAFLSLIPCPPLLIADLGDPKRFHHMLRVFKPTSPMNFGTWVLTAYSGPATFEAARQYLKARGPEITPEERHKINQLKSSGKLIAITDAAGVPLALLLASYTGVLLSSTANPLWCKNTWLAPLFTASAVSTGAEAIGLLMDLGGAKRSAADTHHQHRLLKLIDTAAHIAEAMCMAGFLNQAGEKAAPLTKGRTRHVHHLSLGAIVSAEALKLLPVPRGLRKPKRVLTNLLGLAGGLSMRWAMSFGGHESGHDPHAARINSGTKVAAPSLPPPSATPPGVPE